MRSAAVGPVAALRVYEPLAAFGDAQRHAWSQLVERGEGLDRLSAPRHEREAALRAAVAGQLPSALPAALVDEVDGISVVCPLGLWERSVLGWDAFSADLPESVADLFLPRAVADAAREELELELDEQGSDARGPWVLDSTWHVPLRWFILVEPGERTVSLGEGTVRTGRALLYRTPMSRARRRVARALAVLRRTVADGDIADAVEDLGRWLEGFHPRSTVELDYGGLVHLLDDAELLSDESARDVADALAALSEGRGEDAGAAYARVSARMKALQAVEGRN